MPNEALKKKMLHFCVIHMHAYTHTAHQNIFIKLKNQSLKTARSTTTKTKSKTVKILDFFKWDKVLASSNNEKNLLPNVSL